MLNKAEFIENLACDSAKLKIQKTSSNSNIEDIWKVRSRDLSEVARA